MKIINLTTHAWNVQTRRGWTVIPSAGRKSRADLELVVVDQLDGMDVVVRRFGGTVNLPPPRPDTFYLVSTITAEAAPDRKDLLVPGSKVYDERTGRLLGCQYLLAINGWED